MTNPNNKYSSHYLQITVSHTRQKKSRQRKTVNLKLKNSKRKSIVEMQKGQYPNIKRGRSREREI